MSSSLSSKIISLYENLPINGKPRNSIKSITESVLVEVADYRFNQSHPETSEFIYTEGRYKVRLYIQAEPSENEVVSIRARLAKARRQRIVNDDVNYMIKLDGYDPLMDDYLKVKPLWSFLFKKSYTSESEDSKKELLRDFKFIIQTIKSKGTIGTKILMSKGWARLMGSLSLQQILDGFKDK